MSARQRTRSSTPGGESPTARSAGASGAAQRLAELTEREWSTQVVSLARTLGFLRYHTHDSRRSAHGFPDEVLVRERIVFAELKREKTQPTPDQVAWLDRLAFAGGEVYLWRPSDLDEISELLARRWTFQPADGSLVGTWTTNTVPQLWPKSLWIPGIGRRDRTDNEQQSLLTKGAA